MRKLLFFLAPALLLFACGESKVDDGKGDVVQQNIEATHVVNEAFKTGDISRIDSVVSQDFVDHTDRGDMSRDSLKAMIQNMRQFFPDMKMEVLHEIADSSYVYTWMRFTGNSDGKSGMPAGPYDMQALEVNLLRDGKIIEHWEFMNVQDVINYLPPPAPAAVDSSALKP